MKNCDLCEKEAKALINFEDEGELLCCEDHRRIAFEENLCLDLPSEEERQPEFENFYDAPKWRGFNG